MTFIIPMAGRGSRFVKAGYTEPKYMIEVKGKTLFEYSLESLPLDIADQLIFICLEEHEKYDVSKFIYQNIDHENIKILKLKEITRGQAETVYMVRNWIEKDDEILIYNIDTAFYSKKLKEILLNIELKKDGVLGAFIDKTEDEKWSFAKLDEKNNVIKTTEKDKISDFALSGLYHFTKAGVFFDTAKKWIDSEKTIQGEFYIAPMYNDLIAQGKKFVLNIVDDFIALGTPEEVKKFEDRN